MGAGVEFGYRIDGVINAQWLLGSGPGVVNPVVEAAR